MLVKDFLSPLPESLLTFFEHAAEDSLWKNTDKFTDVNVFPFLNAAKIALIGIEESRGAEPEYECRNASHEIRKKLYQLKKHIIKCTIVDLGNIQPGVTLNDTFAAVAELAATLSQINVIPIFIGGSQDLTYGHYLGYKKLEKIINIVGVDSRFDLGMPTEPLNANTWLGNIVLDQPNYLYNYSHIAHQTYFVGEYAVNMMDNLFFDTYRLGTVRQDIKELEPIVRNADILSIDVSAIRFSDCPAGSKPSPNGLDGEDICQLMYYAGMSDKLEGIGIYEFIPAQDRNQMTASLISQMIWYFIDGFTNRKKDMPDSTSTQFTVYKVALRENNDEIHFLKSNNTGRWWMEVPLNKSQRKLDRHQLVPCSFNDYQTACNNEIPDRWWQALKKLS
jgi:arginase family enzyme